jgi:hypothetical protein
LRAESQRGCQRQGRNLWHRGARRRARCEKLGLFALAAAFALKFAKLITLGAIDVVAFVLRLCNRKSGTKA